MLRMIFAGNVAADEIFHRGTDSQVPADQAESPVRRAEQLRAVAELCHDSSPRYTATVVSSPSLCFIIFCMVSPTRV